MVSKSLCRIINIDKFFCWNIIDNIKKRFEGRYIMYETLKWTKFKTVMTALFQVNGISALKFNSFKNNHIRELELS